MSKIDTDFDELLGRLSKLPDLEPPPHLVHKVMDRIRHSKTSFWRKLLSNLSRPRQVTFRPVPILGSIAILAAVFSLGVLTGTYHVKQVVSPESINTSQHSKQNAEANFLAGRSLMVAGLAAQALPLLQKASLSEPENSEYAYWEGLCFGANGIPEKERSSYLRGIQSSPNMVVILLNLGHNLLEQGEVKAALSQYEKVLAIEPLEQRALYNRGLIYHLLQDYKNEIAAWRSYLGHYKTGKNAFRAVERLNNLKDFEFRTYQIGPRKMIFSQSALLNLQSNDTMKNELETLANSLLNDFSLHLNIVVFNENNVAEAKRKAQIMKKDLVAMLDGREGKRVKLSWFGEKEPGQNFSGNDQLSESLLLFGSRKITTIEEREI